MRKALWLVLLLCSCAWAQPAARPQFFHITPVRPVEELRKEALKAQPPVEHGDFLKPDLVELTKLDPSIKLDIRYATNRNFLSTPVYEEARAFMQRPAAEAVARASQKLHAKGLGLMIHDAYRPWYVTKIFWDATPPADHKFVADPSEGSRHNRGCAVDLTMYDVKTGEAVPMPGLYDEMSERSYPNYAGGTEEERRNRETLRTAMEAEGFTVYEFEWWHFDYKDYKKYPILNLRFNELAAAASPTPNLDGYSGPDGIVTLVVEVSNGRTQKVKVKKSLNPDADRRASEAVMQWKWDTPPTQVGYPSVKFVTLQVKFQKP